MGGRPKIYPNYQWYFDRFLQISLATPIWSFSDDFSSSLINSTVTQRTVCRGQELQKCGRLKNEGAGNSLSPFSVILVGVVWGIGVTKKLGVPGISLDFLVGKYHKPRPLIVCFHKIHLRSICLLAINRPNLQTRNSTKEGIVVDPLWIPTLLVYT